MHEDTNVMMRKERDMRAAQSHQTHLRHVVEQRKHAAVAAGHSVRGVTRSCVDLVL